MGISKFPGRVDNVARFTLKIVSCSSVEKSWSSIKSLGCLNNAKINELMNLPPSRPVQGLKRGRSDSYLEMFPDGGGGRRREL